MSLPAVPDPASKGLPDSVDQADLDARSRLAEFLPTDPAVRKRVFSSLLRAMNSGGGM